MMIASVLILILKIILILLFVCINDDDVIDCVIVMLCYVSIRGWFIILEREKTK